LQQLLFPLRRVDLQACLFFNAANLMNKIGALVQKPKELIVEQIDLRSELG
jgi:hypothetical protein